jgi:acetyl/propionyl-CoA carboxylase alpha subunit
MGAAAVAAARAVDYRGAGTVEFILDPDGRFYFLEMNTRLQVEHPVTEMITGLDLVREQILVASGAALSFKQSDLRQVGHALEARIYAEVPEENFRPSTGTIEFFRPPAGPGIRLDSGVEQGSAVTYHFDPLLAKLIVWAPAREAAIDRMKRALDEFVVLGVRHNIEFLCRIMSHGEFAAGKLDTHFLERHSDLMEHLLEVPPEVLLAASVSSRSAAERGEIRPPGEEAVSMQSDVWTSGPWRNA